MAASGANLASIGYHFGSKEALLNAAMMEAFTEWGQELDQSLPVNAGADPVEELESTWQTVTQSFTVHRPLWVASIEAYAQAQHSPELRDQLAASLENIRTALAGDVTKAHGAVDERTARAVGSVQLALLTGLMVQWLIDPAGAPDGADVTAALRMIAGQPPAPDTPQ